MARDTMPDMSPPVLPLCVLQVSQSVRTKQMTLVLASEDKETAEDWKGAIEAQIRSVNMTFLSYLYVYIKRQLSGRAP
jgi:hypothetical protein